MNSLKFVTELQNTKGPTPQLYPTAWLSVTGRSWALAVPRFWVSSWLWHQCPHGQRRSRPTKKWGWISKDKVHNFNTQTWRAVDGSPHVTPLWVTTDLYWHGLTLQRTVLAPTPFWLQIRHERGNEDFSLPFANLPLLTGGWLMCCIRKRSVPKCRSCRKDNSSAVKSVQPGCSWMQFLWPANSLVTIYSQVRFLTWGVPNLFCLQGIWQSKKQLLRKAQTLLQNQRPGCSSQPKPIPSQDSGTLTAASRTTNRDSSLLQQLFWAASNNWLKHSMARVLEITSLSDKVSIVVIVFLQNQPVASISRTLHETKGLNFDIHLLSNNH